MSQNTTLETILSHRSIRQFKPQPIPSETIEQLVNAARFASTSNHLQCVSIVRITDPTMRVLLKEYCSNQQYVQDAPEFWVFCVDFHKHQQICPSAELDYTEATLIGAVDAGIMAQNVLLAAESLGLGGVYIGSLRNELEKAAELLQLPAHTIPLFGMCLGYPDQDPPSKPRLPAELMFFENHYPAFDLSMVESYDQEVAVYYQKRSNLDMDWSRNVIKSLDKPLRPHVLPFLHKQGLAKK